MNITRHEDGTITQVGSVVRITHGQTPAQDPASSQAEPTSQLRTGDGFVRINHSTGEMVQSSHASYQSGLSPENPQGSVMGSLKTNGQYKTVELEPGNPASRTLLSIAVKDGLVIETAPGVFVDRALLAADTSQKDPVERVQPLPKAPATPDPGIFEKNEVAVWNQETAHVPQHSYDKATAGVTAAIVTQTPERLDGVIAALAESAGIEPELAREYVEVGIELHTEAVARDLVKSVGLNRGEVEALWEHLATEGHPRLQEALQEVTMMGKSTVFRDIAREYKHRQATAAFAATVKA